MSDGKVTIELEPEDFDHLRGVLVQGLDPFVCLTCAAIRDALDTADRVSSGGN